MKNNKEEKRSGAAGTGVSQKDLQLGNTNTEKKALRCIHTDVTRVKCKVTRVNL